VRDRVLTGRLLAGVRSAARVGVDDRHSARVGDQTPPANSQSATAATTAPIPMPFPMDDLLRAGGRIAEMTSVEGMLSVVLLPGIAVPVAFAMIHSRETRRSSAPSSRVT
jgi:hypothetical protein